MKLYRFVEKPSDEFFLKKGWGNEYINMVRYAKFSPSFYDSMPFSTPRKKPNTFEVYTELSKYFYMSLAETILYANQCKEKKLRRGIYSEYLIMEIDIPDDIILLYIGVGFYNYCDNYVECRIPYKTIYQLFAIPENFTDEAIAFYNANINNDYKEDLDEYKRIEHKYREILIKMNGTNMTQYSSFSLYPLLCFKLKTTINTLRFDGIEDSIERLNDYSKISSEIWLNREETYQYSKVLEKIIGTIEGTDKFNPRFSQQELYSFVAPILSDENEKLKLLIKR